MVSYHMHHYRDGKDPAFTSSLLNNVVIAVPHVSQSDQVFFDLKPAA